MSSHCGTGGEILALAAGGCAASVAAAAAAAGMSRGVEWRREGESERLREPPVSASHSLERHAARASAKGQDRLRDAHRHRRGHRALVGFPPDPVGAEILACHGEVFTPLLVVYTGAGSRGLRLWTPGR